MHSIAMLTLPAFLTISFLLYRQSNPMMPFPAFDPDAIPAEKDVV